MSIEQLEARQMLTAVCSPGRDNFTVGLVDCTAAAYEGYTLLAPNTSGDAFLVDVHGRQVHSWTGAPYSGRRGAYFGEDGSLYSSGVVSNPSQDGGGFTGALYIQDWNGDVIWQYEYATADYTLHHDLEVMPNGNILAFAWTVHESAEMIANGRDPAKIPDGEVWGERILELRPTGLTTADIVWEWNLIDHVVQDFDVTKPNFGVIAEHPERLDVNLGATNNADWVHLNAIDYHPQLDQIVVSSPAIDEFWVIDHSTTTAEAATSLGGNSGMGGDFLYRWGNPNNYGAPGDQQLFNQHDVQWIDPGNPGAGNFLAFNNKTSPTSLIYEMVPPVDVAGNYSYTSGAAYDPAAPVWSADTDISASNTSGAQRMPNGNTIFTNGPEGIIGELTLTGDHVWEYVNPVTAEGALPQGSNPPKANVFKSRRYPADFQGFDGRDLSPQGYVEDWTVGDYDLSGTLDAFDVDALCAGLSSGDMIYDVNFDSQLDAADVEHMVTKLLGLSLGDANLDGLVDGADFITWNNNKFQATNLWSRGDFNCDGFVDGADLLIWNANKHQSNDGVRPTVTPKHAARVSKDDDAPVFETDEDPSATLPPLLSVSPQLNTSRVDTMFAISRRAERPDHDTFDRFDNDLLVYPYLF